MEGVNGNKPVGDPGKGGIGVSEIWRIRFSWIRVETVSLLEYNANPDRNKKLIVLGLGD